ncbi:MAG: YcjX family protein [Fimbriiglobus sp.]|nr:YcjX family protein [Fimbriiglobus sp.]
MPALHLKTTECRVGVVGLYSAGKTVLLTSLVNHLDHHDPDRFRLGKPGTAVRKFTPLPPDPHWAGFDYARYRDALVHSGIWPAKTCDRAMYACRFARTDWAVSDCVLKLYDLPGERFADAAMLGRSYAEWSDHLLGRVAADTPTRTACEPYLQALTADAPDDARLVGAYRLSLANLILSLKPFVSPSTFLLDTHGQPAKRAGAAELAAARQSGLPGAEFAPLPADVRAKCPEVAGRFATHFERYKGEVVQPFLAALKSCTSLVVLVDVMMLLAGGVGMYDDNRQILKDLFDVLDPGETVLGTVGRHLSNVFLPRQWRPGWITRVAFVAPKLDLVHPTDRDRTLHLLKRMVGKLADHRDGLEYRYFNVSAVVSTRQMPGEPGERLMVGVPYRGVDGRRMPRGGEQRFGVSAVPDDWPADWPAGKYAFPEVYPLIATRKDYPPDQINLDAVLDFVLG